MERFAFWIGCTTRYFRPETVVSLIKILKKLGVEYSIIDSAGGCCGSVLYNTGQVESAEKNTMKIIKLLNKNRVENLISLCPGCTRTFKERYQPKKCSGLKSVMHIAEFLARHSDFFCRRSRKKVVTYHDPCHLARGLNVVEEPRKLIMHLAELREMKKNRTSGFCCGSGGGVRAYNKELADSTSRLRVGEALFTGANYLITTCPFCERSLADAVKANGSKIKVINLVDFLADYCNP